MHHEHHEDQIEETQDLGVSQQDSELTQEDLEQQDVSELPDREAMSLVNANLAAPINAAVAANVLSDDSIAYANAQQYAPINQEM